MIYTIDRVSFFIFTEQGPKHMKRGVNMERTMTRLEIVLGQLGQNDIAEETEAAETWLGNVWEAVQDLREDGLPRDMIEEPKRITTTMDGLEQVISIQDKFYGPAGPSIAKIGRTKLMDTDDMYDLMDRMFFSMEFSRLRREQNLSFHQLQSQTGISNSYLSVLERGKKPVPTVSILRKLSTALNVGIDSFIRPDPLSSRYDSGESWIGNPLYNQLAEVAASLDSAHLKVLLRTAQALKEIELEYTLNPL